MARIFTATTFKQLDGLMKKHEAPDFILIEPQSTGFSGTSSIQHITQISPNTKIIAITDIHHIENSKLHTKREFQHILNKTASTAEIIAGLEDLIKSEGIKPNREDGSAEPLRISRRHRQLIQLLDRGLTNREIAEHLEISENTVKIHFFRLFKILNVRNRLQALHFAKTNGWLI